MKAEGVAELFEGAPFGAAAGRVQGVDARLVFAGGERGEWEEVAAVLVRGAAGGDPCGRQ